MADGSGIVFIGFLLTVAWIAALIFVMRRFRINRDPSKAQCALHPKEILPRLYNFHWKLNLWNIVTIALCFFVIPTSMHLATCANRGTTDGVCSWSLAQYSNASSVAHASSVPGAGAVGFAFAMLILENFFSIAACIFSLRWHPEDQVAATGEYNHLISEVRAPATGSAEEQVKFDDMLYEWQWTRWIRWLTSGVGVFIIIFGFTGRVIVYVLAHDYAAYGIPTLDAYSQGEIVVVILFSTIHFFMYMARCWKVTFYENHFATNDYLPYHCPVCEGRGATGLPSSATPLMGQPLSPNSGGGAAVTGQPVAAAVGGQKCETCRGTGLVWHLSNTHSSPEQGKDEFPVKSLKP